MLNFLRADYSELVIGARFVVRSSVMCVYIGRCVVVVIVIIIIIIIIILLSALCRVFTIIQGVTGGTDQTSGGCSLC